MEKDVGSLVRSVAEYYDARASEYDISAGFLDPISEVSREELKREFQPLFSGLDVLEIGCGTGYWTRVISETARSVHAIDINPSMVYLARKKLKDIENVTFQIADAYTMEGVPGGFNSAFAFWWWSHVPVPLLKDFISVLHGKLIPGALVLFVDQLPSAYEADHRCKDRYGNTLETRRVSDGRSFDIVKNFPTEDEVLGILEPYSSEIEHRSHPEHHSWSISYRVKK
ncbi:MAG: class I SAM-dependent methyltransferase [Candidatus Thermoplasmatota archaeon]|nr:class I SAM-dependent methyltransferase [Candidatus Thermoplasmatota archaeon]